MDENITPQPIEEAPAEKEKPGIGEIISGLPKQLSAIPENITENVVPEIDRTKAAGKAKGKAIGEGSGLTIAAIILVGYGLLFILLALAAALATAVGWGGGFLIVGIIVLIVGGIMTYIAKKRFEASKKIDVSLKTGIKNSADGFVRGLHKPEDGQK